MRVLILVFAAFLTLGCGKSGTDLPKPNSTQQALDSIDPDKDSKVVIDAIGKIEAEFGSNRAGESN